MSDKEAHGSSRSESIQHGDVSFSANTVPHVSPSILASGAKSVPAGLRTLHSASKHGEDHAREIQTDDLRLQDVQEQVRDSAGQQHSGHNPRWVQSTFVSPLPPPPPPPPPPPLSRFASSTSFYVPPPPPIFVGSVASLAPDATWNVHAEKLDREQGELRDLRDELLGSRFKLADMRKELRDLHIRTTAKDGFAFNLLRQYLNKDPASLPQDIEEAFNEASLLRDSLGLLEDKYDAAEANYNTLEWNYSSKEAIFVEEALRKKLVPIGTVSRSRSADDLNIEQLTQGMTDQTEEPRNAWNHTMYCETSDPGGDDLILTEPNPQSEASGKEKQVSPSDTSHVNDPATISPTERDIEGSQKKQEHPRWARKVARIDAWLLETVADSPLHKLYLKAIYDVGYTDEDTWWKHTSQLLTESREELPPFRTGDSTVSDQTTSKPNIPKTVKAPSQNIPTLDIASSTSLASESRLTAQLAVSRSGDLLHPGGKDIATLKPPERSASGSPVSYMTSRRPSRRTSCSDTGDTQSDATSHDFDSGGLPVDSMAANREQFDGRTHTMPMQHGHRNDASFTLEPSLLPINTHVLQSELQADSAVPSAPLESPSTPLDQVSNHGRDAHASEAGQSSICTQTFQPEPLSTCSSKQSPTFPSTAHSPRNHRSCLVM